MKPRIDETSRAVASAAASRTSRLPSKITTAACASSGNSSARNQPTRMTPLVPYATPGMKRRTRYAVATEPPVASTARATATAESTVLSPSDPTCELMAGEVALAKEGGGTLCAARMLRSMSRIAANAAASPTASEAFANFRALSIARLMTSHRIADTNRSKAKPTCAVVWIRRTCARHRSLGVRECEATAFIPVTVTFPPTPPATVSSPPAFEPTCIPRLGEIPPVCEKATSAFPRSHGQQDCS
mmetsp:Transcript_2994/g.7320  ORF Transcript_2994/g.7320 Transcript_2994/m.7320 type:complete len:245 (-) Transcript_2994:498-1232(-)